MADGKGEADIKEIVAETVEFVVVEPDGDGWVGQTPEWFGERIFGGFVLGQAVHATQEGRPVFTMTCSFTADGEGYEYSGHLDPEIPGPEATDPELDGGPWEIGSLGPTDPAGDGVHDST